MAPKSNKNWTGGAPRLQEDAPEIKKTIEELPNLARELINKQNNNLNDKEFFQEFSKTIYQSLLGIAAILAGGILLSIEINIGWGLIGAGFLVILLSKPK